MHRSCINMTRLLPFALLIVLGTLAPAQASEAKAYWHFSGAFHPAVAHFPIALLVVAGVVELYRFLRGRKIPGDAGYTCLMLGAAGAVVAAVLGWANADHAGDFNGTQAQVLALHRWLGVGVAVGSVIMAIIATRSRLGDALSGIKRVAFVAGLLLCTALVGLTGSYGGKLTFGVDYYETVYNETIGALEQKKNETPAPETDSPAKKPLAANEKAVSVETKPVNKADEPAIQNDEKVEAAQPAAPVTASQADVTANGDVAVVAETASARVSYINHIKPLFTASCIKCHGEGKAKADYRMDTREHALTAGDSGEPPIVPGKSDESLLVKVIEGKGEYKDSMMPPKGVIFTAEQVALVRKWIDEGAVWDE